MNELKNKKEKFKKILIDVYKNKIEKIKKNPNKTFCRRNTMWFLDFEGNNIIINDSELEIDTILHLDDELTVEYALEIAKNTLSDLYINVDIMEDNDLLISWDTKEEHETLLKEWNYTHFTNEMMECN